MSGFIQDADMKVYPGRKEAIFRWTLHNAAELCREKERIYSPPCYVRNVPWQAEIYCNSSDFGLYVHCDLPLDDDSWTCNVAKAHLQILPLTTKRKPIFRKLSATVFSSKHSGWGFKVTEVDFVLNCQNGYIKNDTIEIEVYIAVEKSTDSLLTGLRNKDSSNNEGTFETPALIQAIKQKDLAKCITLISEESVNTKDESGRTPLMWASYKGNLNIVKMLTDANADINVADCFGYTSLMRAVESDNTKVVEFLLNKGAEVDFSTKDCLKCSGSKKLTALHLAAHYFNKRMVVLESITIAKILTEKGADITLTSAESALELIEHRAKLLVTPATIIWSIKQKNFTLTDKLLQMAEHIKIKDIDVNGTPLLIGAIRACDLETVKFLVERGAHPCKRDKNGDVPLLVAVSESTSKIVNLLLENGALPMVHSALYTAILCENSLLAPIMLDNGANVNLIAKDGYTPLTKSIELDNFELVELLIKNKADVNLIDKNKCPPISMAVQNNNLEIIEHLLENGANPNVHDENGSTPLIKCIEKGHSDRVQLLLKNRADVNFGDGNETTPLMTALTEDNPRIFKYLLQNGASLDFSNETKEKIVFTALESDNWISLMALIEAGVDLSAFQHLIQRLAEENVDFAMFWNRRKKIKLEILS